MEYGTNAQGLIENSYHAIAIDGTVQPVSIHLPLRSSNVKNRPGANAVTFVDGADPNRNVRQLDIPGDKQTPLTHFTDGVINDHEWSPDGQHIALIRRLADGENVWLLNKDGSAPKQVTHFNGLEVIQIIWAADNVHLVADAGQVSDDVVLVKNFK
jgi:hypothetical protein